MILYMRLTCSYIIVKVFGSFRLDAELFLKISYNHTDTMTDIQNLTPPKCNESIKLKIAEQKEV